MNSVCPSWLPLRFLLPPYPPTHTLAGIQQLACHSPTRTPPLLTFALARSGMCDTYILPYRCFVILPHRHSIPAPSRKRSREDLLGAVVRRCVCHCLVVPLILYHLRFLAHGYDLWFCRYSQPVMYSFFFVSSLLTDAYGASYVPYTAVDIIRSRIYQLFILITPDGSDSSGTLSD